MKQIFLSLFMLTTLFVHAQEKNIDLNIVGNLVASKASVSEVINKFGSANEELIKPEKALLQYKINESLYLFKFNEKKRLYDFVFIDQNKNLPNHLTYTDLKEARNLKTKVEIHDKLGQPTQVVINSDNETWYYAVGKETASQSLLVRFDISSPTIVKSYNYYVDSDNASSFSSDVINSFVKGLTSSIEIEKQLGKPSKIILSSESESWHYISKNSTLVVYFDKQSKVDDFIYQKTSELTK